MDGNSVCYKVFRAWGVTPWEDLFDEVAAFASEIGPYRLIGISHSAGEGDSGAATVWYWREPVK